MKGFTVMLVALVLVAGAVSAQATLNTTGDTTYGSGATSTKKIGSTTHITDRHGNVTKCNVVGSSTYCN